MPMKTVSFLVLFVWWLAIQDKQGQTILMEWRYESTCTFYEKLFKRIHYLKVKGCEYKEPTEAIG